MNKINLKTIKKAIFQYYYGPKDQGEESRVRDWVTKKVRDCASQNNKRSFSKPSCNWRVFSFLFYFFFLFFFFFFFAIDENESMPYLGRLPPLPGAVPYSRPRHVAGHHSANGACGAARLPFVSVSRRHDYASWRSAILHAKTRWRHANQRSQYANTVGHIGRACVSSDTWSWSCRTKLF